MSQEPLPEEFWRWYSLGAVFGDTPACRILQFLSEHRSTDYTLKEIARQTRTGYRTFYRYIPQLIQLGILKETRRIGIAKLYRLDEESPIVKALQKLSLEIGMKNAEKAEIKEAVAARVRVKTNA